MFVLYMHDEDGDIQIIACSSNKSRLEEMKVAGERKEQFRKEIIDRFHRSRHEFIRENPFNNFDVQWISDEHHAESYHKWFTSIDQRAFDVVIEEFGDLVLGFFPNSSYLKAATPSLYVYEIEEVEEV